eukprot:scaffold347_cov239-Pinguiococcus_pyrenoidosus.AAC.45
MEGSGVHRLDERDIEALRAFSTALDLTETLDAIQSAQGFALLICSDRLADQGADTRIEQVREQSSCHAAVDDIRLVREGNDGTLDGKPDQAWASRSEVSKRRAVPA